MSTCRILIVDDDALAAESAAKILGNHDFEVACVATASDALDQLHLAPPEVALLELWLPEQDGLALLRQIRRHYPQVRVLLTSDHGNLSTALQAIRLGAIDFIEKPYDATTLLNRVRQAADVPSPTTVRTLPDPPQKSPQPTTTSISPHSPHFTTEAPRQRTLQQSVVLRGQGLQSGDKTAIHLSPMPAGHGIRFRDITTDQRFPADIEAVDSTTFCTSLRCGTSVANTIEHLMSALHAYRLTNLLVTIHDEIPIMDGSARDFCLAIEEAGIAEQTVEAECFNGGEALPCWRAHTGHQTYSGGAVRWLSGHLPGELPRAHRY